MNCHPVLFQQICEKHSIPCPVLDDYIGKRDDILKELSEKCAISPKDC